MKSVLTNTSHQRKKKSPGVLFEPILVYACEALTVSNELQKKLKETEKLFLQRMLRISRTAKKSNKTVLEKLTLQGHP